MIAAGPLGVLFASVRVIHEPAKSVELRRPTAIVKFRTSRRFVPASKKDGLALTDFIINLK